MLLLCTVLYVIALHSSVWYYFALCFMVLFCTVLYVIALHDFALLRCMVLLCFVLCYVFF